MGDKKNCAPSGVDAPQGGENSERFGGGWLDHVEAVGGVERTVFAPQDVATLGQQAAAVERAAVNQRGHCDNLRLLLARKKRSLAELIQQAQWARALEEAATTMRRLANARLNQ